MSQRQKLAVVLTVVALIVAGTVLMSLDWNGPRLRADAEVTIFAGLVVATVIMLAFLLASRFAMPFMACPACSRRIPNDANLCPYCGTRIR